jgi:hypothetical protein
VVEHLSQNYLFEGKASISSLLSPTLKAGELVSRIGRALERSEVWRAERL